MKRLILISLCVLAVAGTASGNTPYKWIQWPDLTPTGIDVDSTNPGKLADDFLCTMTGYITEVHIWGSWKGDILPYGSAAGAAGDPNAVTFNLSFYSDIPAGIDGGSYSQPGEQLRNFSIGPGEFTVQKYTDALEDWYNPVNGDYFPANHTGVWLYSFVAPPGANPADLFYQEEDTVYWLGIEAFPQDTGATFGWKTAETHWNDDAVFDQPLGSWEELRYPDGQSLDLAFEIGGIIPEPATICLLGLGTLALLRKRRA
jgi:hypothetical protein